MSFLSKIIVVLIFLLAGTFFIHNITSINADIGRHIKLGEIIWQTGEVPGTNLFSYTAPNHPFINHHWLSEVVFYKVFALGNDWLSGLKLIIIFKAVILLAAYFLLFLIVRRGNIAAVALSFLVSIVVFSARTEPRPEIFSYLIFAAYLLVIYKTRQATSNKQQAGNYLWILPILQVFWVNLHIYFIIGPMIYLLFLIDQAADKKIWKLKSRELIKNSKLKIGIFTLILSANFANPNFIAGALYPFNVFREYGYSVAENSSLFFLVDYFGHWAPQDKLFLISLFILIGSFAAYFLIRRGRTSAGPRSDLRIFDLLLTAMIAALSFKMQRNIPLFALVLWPVLAENLNGVWDAVRRPADEMWNGFWLRKPLLVACRLSLAAILAAGIYLVAGGKFYDYLDSAKTFGLGISRSAQDGVDFIKKNNIQNSVFNNFDIGSYLIWQLYPDQKVFIDGRPEAYPIEFFEKVYKPMQRDEGIWREMADKYGINYVFFAHTDMTEWADEFLIRINRDPDWPMVFLNDTVVVFIKDNEADRRVISEQTINEQNINEKAGLILDKLDKKDDNAFINYGNVLFRFRFLAASAMVFEALIENQPDNPYGYQGAAYAYATMNDPATQEKAARNFEKAIRLGFKTFNNYFTLGIIEANLGNFFGAEENIKKALRLDRDSQNAKQVLEAIKRKQGL